VPACANMQLLTNITRNEWGFKGYVVSDDGALANIIRSHHYLNNSIDVAAASIKAGCNLELGKWVKGIVLESFFIQCSNAGHMLRDFIIYIRVELCIPCKYAT